MATRGGGGGGFSNGTKRKRGERAGSKDASDEGALRPSPHHPASLDIAQNSQHHAGGSGPASPIATGRGGGRRGSGGGRGARGGRAGGSTNTERTQARGAPSAAQENTIPAPSQTPSTSTIAAPVAAAPLSADSRPTQTFAVATQQQDDTDQEPDPEILPYDYAQLTADVVENWEEYGRSKIIEAGRQAIEQKDNVMLGNLYQEIIRAALDLRLSASKGGAAVKEIVELPGSNEGPLHWINASSSFLDNVSCVPGGFRGSREEKALRELIFATGISPHTMRTELDIELLELLGLVREKFYDQRTRVQTQLLYRQHNYNLLREESEGYSKLITEMFSTSGSVPPNVNEIKKSYDHVMSMIGTFDLDVGRVLDITLDAFAAMLVRNFRFFVKFLRISTWWPDHRPDDILSGENLSFPTLPMWAQPENDGFDSPTDEERSKWLDEREDRDRRFWDLVRASGSKAFFLLGGPQSDLAKIDALPPVEKAPKSAAKGVKKTGQEEEPAWDESVQRAWAKATGLAPPKGNWVAAQVLGFKLHFYASEARSPTDDLPANLIYLTALLIKIGFISLLDLYPHLWPDDSAMHDVKLRKLKEKQEREVQQRPGGGKLNALAMAGALSDEPVPGASMSRVKEGDAKRSASAKPEDKVDKSGAEKVSTDKMEVDDEPLEELPEPADQKVALLKSLLCIGALPEALFILGKFPWLLDAFPELPEYLHRILHHCLSKVYDSAKDIPNELDVHGLEQVPDLDQSGVARGHIRTIDQPGSKSLRWPHPDKYDADVATEYRFYWDDWSNNVPICQSVDDVFALCNSLLNLTGVKIGQDPTLLTKIARIGRYSLITDNTEENKKRWVDLSKRIIVPALSLSRHNSGAIAEVWELIRQYPITTRYNIYAEWFTGQISRMDDMKSAFDLARAETRDVLKRISKTNVKPMARALSKVSTSSPGVVFSVALNQIESYNNLVEVIVECARYFTFLSYDVLTWTLTNSLGARGRNRVQADGMLRSKWLGALALFSGKVFKRYSVMNPSPILQYVASEVRKGNTTDLIILEELITSMAGIVSDASFNEAQTVAMAGGPVLQGQIMLQLLDRRHDSSLKTTSRRLMKSLTEPGLAAPLLISMAQALQTCIYRVPEDEAFLKVLANLYDETYRVLVQYLDLLRTNFSTIEFNAAVPQLAELMGDYGLEPALAFWIYRPSIAAEISLYDEKRIAAEKLELKPQKGREARVDVPELTMTDTDNKSAEPTTDAAQAAEENGEEPDGVSKATGGTAAAENHGLTPQTAAEMPWHPVIKPLVERTAEYMPEEARAVLNPYFYFTFWQLSLEDVHVPMSSYEDETGRLKRKLLTVSNDRSDLTSRGKEKRDEDKKLIMDTQSRLQSELSARIATYRKIRARINKEKDLWFANCRGKWDMLNVTIIEQCILPRIRLSSVDALYTVKFLKHLHSSGTVNFRTVGLFDQFFNIKRLSAMFFICTAQEAENVGKFINELVRDLGLWHADRKVYEKEAWGSKKELPGFKAKTGDKGTSDLMDYESFRRILGKWHTNLHNALKTCFSGGEYMHIRNAINILKAMATNFPSIDWMGRNEVSLLTELSKTETREDLKLAAMSLVASLKRREKHWVMSQAFMLSTAKPNGAKATTSDIPEPALVGTLNAKAPEFKPRSSPSVNGTPKLSAKPSPIATDKGEIEDGEVNSAGLPPKALDRPIGDQPSNTPGVKDEQNDTDAIKVDDSTPGHEITAKKETRSSTKREESPAPPTTMNSNMVPSKPEARPTHLPPIPPKATNNGRASHSLPNRPDAGLSRAQDRRGPAGDRHLPSEPRDAHHADRHNARTEYPRQDRERYSASWNDEKAPSRPGNDDRYDYDQVSSRDSRPLLRNERTDRHQRERNAYEYDTRANDLGRSTREPVPVGSTKSSNPTRPDRTRSGIPSLDDDRAPPLYIDRRNDVQRPESHGGSSSQRGSRATSPSRRDERAPRQDRPPREESHPSDLRRPPPDDGYHSRSRYDDGRGGNGGYRGERPSEPSHPQSERLRESFAPGSGGSGIAPHGYESRGRGVHEGERPPQESRYGRLNADTPPSAATSRGGQGHSNTRNPQVNPSVGNSGPSATQPSWGDQERSAPSGPLSGRPQTRSTAAYNRSGPPTGSTAGSAPSAPVADASGANVHPDRLNRIDANIPISGPRNAQVPSPTDNRSSGPLPPHGGDRRSDKRFATVNTILSQTTPPGAVPERAPAGATIRGRGGRSGGGGSLHSPVTSEPPPRDGQREKYLSQPSDVPPSRAEPAPPPRSEAPRELFSNRGAPTNSGPLPPRDEQSGGSRYSMRDTERRPPRARDGRSASPRRNGPSGRGRGAGSEGRGGGHNPNEISRSTRGGRDYEPHHPHPPSNRRGGGGGGLGASGSPPESSGGPRELRPRGGPPATGPTDREPRRGPPPPGPPVGPRDSGDDRRGGPSSGASSGGGGGPMGSGGLRDSNWARGPPRDDEGYGRESRGRGGGDLEGGGSGRKRGRPPMDDGYPEGGKRRRGQH